MNEEEITKLIKDIIVILKAHSRNDLIESIISLHGDYRNLKEELNNFMMNDFISSTDEEEMHIDDEELVIKVDSKGFYSLK